MKLLALLLLLAPARLGAGYLSAREVGLIRQYWPDYSYAAKKTGVPVAILPAIHWRESGLYKGYWSKPKGKLVKNIGGPFMLDCGGDGEEFSKRVREHERRVWKSYGGHGNAPKVSQNFRFAVLVAAHDLKTKHRGKSWADAVWGYNGRASWASMNENAYLYSDPHKKKRLVVRYRNRAGELISYTDERPGVMVIYQEILKLKGVK